MSHYINREHQPLALPINLKTAHLSTSVFLFSLHIMSDDWEAKTVIGFKRQTAKVTKKDSDLNGAYPLNIWTLLNF